MADKPRVAIFDFTGCEGCELNQLNFEDQLLDILAQVAETSYQRAEADEERETFQSPAILKTLVDAGRLGQ